jgi:hypothetical protein
MSTPYKTALALSQGRYVTLKQNGRGLVRRGR